MPRTLKMILIMLIPALAVFGCHDKDREAVAQIQQLIQQNLKPGDPAAKIEAFLQAKKIPYGFDGFAKRYQCRVPSSARTDARGVESVVLIYIYVNADHSFQRAEVEAGYTSF